MTNLLKLLAVLAVLVAFYEGLRLSPKDLFGFTFVTLSVGLMLFIFVLPIFARKRPANSPSFPTTRTASGELCIGGGLPNEVAAELVKCFGTKESIVATVAGLNFKSIVLTNECLYVIDVNSFPRLTFESLKLEHITGIEASAGVFTCGITITLLGHDSIKVTMDKQFYDSSLEFVSRIRKSIVEIEEQHAKERSDPVSQLQKLAQLRDQRILSSEEFETKKKELLGRI